MTNEELINEIRRAEQNIEQFASEYYANENECSTKLKSNGCATWCWYCL